MKPRGLAGIALLLVCGACASRPPSAQAPRVDYANPADEQFVEVPAARPSPPPPVAPAAPSPAATAVPQREQPAAAAHLQVLAVAVRPPTVAPGGQVELVINYELSGLAPGRQATLTEERQLVHADAVIATFSDTLVRVAGPYTSAKAVTVPVAASPGLYRLRVRVYGAGAEAEGAAVFEVR